MQSTTTAVITTSASSAYSFIVDQRLDCFVFFWGGEGGPPVHPIDTVTHVGARLCARMGSGQKQAAPPLDAVRLCAACAYDA